MSFIVGLLLDKFAWHLPLYRQHQRLEDAGTFADLLDAIQRQMVEVFLDQDPRM